MYLCMFFVFKIRVFFLLNFPILQMSFSICATDFVKNKDLIQVRDLPPFILNNTSVSLGKGQSVLLLNDDRCRRYSPVPSASCFSYLNPLTELLGNFLLTMRKLYFV